MYILQLDETNIKIAEVTFMLEFAELLTIKGKDGERWTVDGSTLQDTWLSQSD